MAAKASTTNPPKKAGLGSTSRTVKRGKGVTPVDNLPVYVVGGEFIEGEGGADGGGGSTTTSTVRVTIADDDALVLAIAASLSALDDWDSNDRAKVSLIPGQDGIAAGAGAVGATVPRTTLASDDPAVVSLAVMDDWDESDRAKVNPIAGQAGVAAGAGAVSALVQRVTLASDDPAVALLTSILAELQAHTALLTDIEANTAGP